ncbi:MAG: hypothetical protein IH827_06920, partial [Myxococcales bacterium]|nr:hypothetical protein [Myxococcales bacterium]
MNMRSLPPLRFSVSTEELELCATAFREFSIEGRWADEFEWDRPGFLAAVQRPGYRVAPFDLLNLLQQAGVRADLLLAFASANLHVAAYLAGEHFIVALRFQVLDEVCNFRELGVIGPVDRADDNRVKRAGG